MVCHLAGSMLVHTGFIRGVCSMHRVQVSMGRNYRPLLTTYGVVSRN